MPAAHRRCSSLSDWTSALTAGATTAHASNARDKPAAPFRLHEPAMLLSLLAGPDFFLLRPLITEAPAPVPSNQGNRAHIRCDPMSHNARSPAYWARHSLPLQRDGAGVVPSLLWSAAQPLQGHRADDPATSWRPLDRVLRYEPRPFSDAPQSQASLCSVAASS